MTSFLLFIIAVALCWILKILLRLEKKFFPSTSNTIAAHDDLDGADDELYEEAKKVVIKYQKASTSFLQRKLGIGYARSARIIDALEDEEIIGPGIESTHYEVLVESESQQD